jgi:hypothetical protein
MDVTRIEAEGRIAALNSTEKVRQRRRLNFEHHAVRLQARNHHSVGEAEVVSTQPPPEPRPPWGLARLSSTIPCGVKASA